MSKKKDGFNTPFTALKSLAKKEEPAKPKTNPWAAPPKSQKAQTSDEEERTFLEAMAGSRAIDKRHALPVDVPKLNARIVSEDAEALAQLYDLVAGRGDFALTNTEETLEGSAPGVDQRLLSALKKGDFSFQVQLDLRGMTSEEATRAVDPFLSQAKREGKRCVLIVHGRGLDAKSQISALREQVTVWLDRGRMGKLALAFCTARPQDGGKDALYVLLRR